MTIRLGFVGVGKHAQRMAKAFRECGAEVVAFDRASGDALAVGVTGLGELMPWREMVTSEDIDAIVCCSPPDVTLAVADECLKSATRCCATKPLGWTDFDALLLQDSEDMLHRGIYVDLWRLYSPSWQALKAEVADREIRSMRIDFYGNGPVRSTHDGFDDYAPWALAFMLDLGVHATLKWSASPGFSRWQAIASDPDVQLQTGSGFSLPRMRVQVNDDLEWLESDSTQGYFKTDQPMVQCHRDVALRGFVRAFMAGEPSDTLRISCEATRLMIDGRRQCAFDIPSGANSKQ